MKYESKRFNVGVGGTKEYRDNWDTIFGKKDQEPKKCSHCEEEFEHVHHQTCWRCNKFLAVPAGTTSFTNSTLCADCASQVFPDP